MTSLQVEGLRYTYPTGLAVGPLDLDLDRGVVHLRGPNGSGKTTLLRCLCGALRRSEGTMRIRGRDPREDPEARCDVAYVSAEPELPDLLTVDEAWQELAALRRAPEWDGADLRRRFGVPGGLRLSQCSAGQRRIAELVAGAAGDPHVMLLDEPFANLDEDRCRTLAQQLRAWAEHRVLVVTGHLPLPVPAEVVDLVAPSVA